MILLQSNHLLFRNQQKPILPAIYQQYQSEIWMSFASTLPKPLLFYEKSHKVSCLINIIQVHFQCSLTKVVIHFTNSDAKLHTVSQSFQCNQETVQNIHLKLRQPRRLKMILAITKFEGINLIVKLLPFLFLLKQAFLAKKNNLYYKN